MVSNHAHVAHIEEDGAWTMRPSATVVKHSLCWALILLALFVAIYGSTNWITSLRDDRFRLWFDWELDIPLVPWMVWPYLSLVASFFLPMFVLDKEGVETLCRRLAVATVISGIAFLLLPAELGFVRTTAMTDHALAYRFLHAFDLPHNLAPSLHVSWSLIVLLTLRARSAWFIRRILELWLVLLLVSVVLTHQHHVLDGLGGILVALMCFAAVRREGGGFARGEESMKTLIALFALLCAIQTSAVQAAESEQDKKDHDELRALLKTFTEAFNTRNLDPLRPHLHKDFTVTMVNQDLVTNPNELKGYLDKQFTGPGALLKDVKIKPDADIPTIFLEGRIGINRGSSVDTYTLKDDRVFTLNTRWTGTAIKEDDKWKVLNAHIGLNIIDNPILDAMEKMKWMWAGGGLALGLIIGFIVARLMRKSA